MSRSCVRVGFEVGADLLGMLTNVPALVVAVAEDPEQALTPPLAQSLRSGGFAGSCGFLPDRGSVPAAQALCPAEPAARAAGAAAAGRSRTRARSVRRGGFGTAPPRQLQERIARLDEAFARISAMLPLLRGGDDREQEP
jgi:hypothetical protein